MKPYLLDTNHLSPALLPVSPLRELITQRYRQGTKFITCWPTLCELEAGIGQTRNPERNRRALRELLKKVKIRSTDWTTVRKFAHFFLQATRSGRSLSHVDLILASLASQYKATLLTTDRDFEAFPEIKTENWLSQ